MVKSSQMSWIVVSDIEKARKFFSDIGLKECQYTEEYKWAEFSGADGGTRLGVADEDSEMKAGTNAVVTFTVDNIEKSKADLESKGVQMHGDIIEVPGHVKMQMFSDLDGNKFQIVEML